MFFKIYIHFSEMYIKVPLLIVLLKQNYIYKKERHSYETNDSPEDPMTDLYETNLSKPSLTRLRGIDTSGYKSMVTKTMIIDVF